LIVVDENMFLSLEAIYCEYRAQQEEISSWRIASLKIYTKLFCLLATNSYNSRDNIFCEEGSKWSLERKVMRVVLKEMAEKNQRSHKKVKSQIWQ